MIISNNLVGKMPIPKEAIIRVNLAWVKSLEEAKNTISNSIHDIYLDFPSGRTKPPVPTITIEEALELSLLPKVRYFAVSNAEDINDLIWIMKRTSKTVVPKIETMVGVKNIDNMIDMGITHIMLDKDDLYLNVGGDNYLYNLLVEDVRKHKNIKIFELQGVCFD